MPKFESKASSPVPKRIAPNTRFDGPPTFAGLVTSVGFLFPQS